MLTEHFVASTGIPFKGSGTSTAKDAGIFIHEFQPLLSQRSTSKKSATSPNCLAISDTHVFAAQAEKAVVNVYSREHGNQEATVPFTERITCITLTCENTILVLGTAEGRLFMWDTTNGRQISTSQAHLQPVMKVVLDPTGNFLLSASEDSTVHVWSLPSLLSFSSSGVQSPTPIRTFSSHRSAVSALEIGHGSGFCNFAVSASKDKTCFIWDYHTNTVLRTFLLPESPTCLALDAADRAVYIGYEDGCLQQLDLFAPLSGSAKGITNSTSSSVPIQPFASSKWRSPDQSFGSVLSLSLAYGGCTILSGHGSGNILSWDVGKSGLSTSILQTPLPGPVSNIVFLPVAGFARAQESKTTLRVPTAVKPKFGVFDSATGAVPGNYIMNIELSGDMIESSMSVFDEAICAPSFSTSLLEDGLQELSSFRTAPQANGFAASDESEDFMALDEPDQPRQLTLEEQNSALKAELEALRRLQVASFDKLERINAEKKALLEREQKRVRRISGSHQPNGDGRIGLVEDSSSDD